MIYLAFRLKPGELLKEELERRAAHIKAGVLLSIVGSLDKAVLRMAGASALGDNAVKNFTGPFEIVSGTGTFSSNDGCHIHISIADNDGKVIGGHLKDGCIVRSTAEIVIGVFEADWKRIPDKDTGYNEIAFE
ncbi:MAG: PPC domain-containing DNA-binding protein [bacterium]